MRLRQIALISACTLVAAVPASPATTHKPVRKAAAKAAPAKRPKPILGQRTIEDNRAAEIQAALVKAGYLTSPSGHWDNETESAMTKFQADNGWQTKWVPDSRAIIKLGLGPSSSTSATSHYLPPSVNLHQNYVPVEVYSAYKPYDPSASATYTAASTSSTSAPAASYTPPALSSAPPHPPTYTARVASNGYTAPAASAPRAITALAHATAYVAPAASSTPSPTRVAPAPAAAASSPYPAVKPAPIPKPTITADASSDGLE